MRKRQYEVSGTDDLGDVHTFATDDRERAEEIVAIMGADLDDVVLAGVARQPRHVSGEGFIAIYRWRVQPEHETSFKERWHDLTMRGRDLGAFGSCLTQSSDGEWVRSPFGRAKRREHRPLR